MRTDERHCPNCGHGVLSWEFMCPGCGQVSWNTPIGQYILWWRRGGLWGALGSGATLLLVVGIAVGGVRYYQLSNDGAAANELQTTTPQPSQESQTPSPPEMVNVVRLTNGSVLYAKTVSTEGETVRLELPDLGQVTFMKAEIASIEAVPTDTVSHLAAQAGESHEGLVYVNGQWTSPNAFRQPRSNQYSTYHYYPGTEQGLAKAQRALEQAIKNGATSEVQQLRDTIQQIRSSLVEQQDTMRKQLEVKEQVEKAKQAAKTKAEKRMGVKPKSVLETEMGAVQDHMANPDVSIDSGPPIQYQTRPICTTYGVDPNTGQEIVRRAACP